MNVIHKRRWPRVVLWIVGIIVLLILLAILAANIFLGYSKPKIEGEVLVSVLDSNVTVIRDEIGVPHIDAKSDADLYRAQGYVQAQDRLFQMDLSRRQASGRLSEVIGEAAIDTDKFFRTFSLRYAAELSYNGYNAEAKQVLDWFTEGVNAYINEVKGTNKLSFEFKLLGYEPEPWTPVDSITIGKFMAYDLGGNWNLQAFRHWALQNYTEGEFQELIISYPSDAQSIIQSNFDSPVQVAGEFDTSLIREEFNGSNNWVVSGSKTASGAPLLADDPHLGLSSPSVWYQMHLQSPEQNVSGVIFAGVPGIILGHNENIAWGVTNVGPDVQDLYIEKVHPEDPYQFLYDGEWYDAEVRKEPIAVKGGDIVEFEVITTKHGPIISDRMYDDTIPTALFSLQWTALEPTLELQAVLGFNKATNWNEFETALLDFNAPAQNFVFADTDGNIAYKANGNIPIRKQGTAQLPVPGDSSEYGWEGYIPYDELPSLVNPEAGFIATANNQVIGKAYPYYITNFWAQEYRYERIAELLNASDSLTVDDMKAIQMDAKNLQAVEFLPELIDTLKQNVGSEYDDYITLLEKWDYMDDADQAAPLVFHFMMDNMQESLFVDQMPDDLYKLMPGKSNLFDQMLRNVLSGETVLWINKQGGLDTWVASSFKKAIENLKEDYGKNFNKWQWGDFHQVEFDHPIGGANVLLGWLLNAKQLPVDGSAVTPMAAKYDEDGNTYHGASWRFIADLSDLSSAEHIVGPGQSGHFKSKWYHNQVQAWADGTYHSTSIIGDVKENYTLLLKAK